MFGWIPSERANELAALAAAAAVLIALGLPIVQAWWRWFNRPVLVADFQNKPRWRRAAAYVDSSSRWGLFVRVRVRNNGWTTARDVTGRLVEILDVKGRPLEQFEPFALHWVGSLRGPGTAPKLDLLPGQEEYLDVFRIDDGQDPCEEQIELEPQDPTPRGIPWTHAIAGQTLRIAFSASNAAGAGVELLLPREVYFAVRFLSVKHRPFGYLDPALTPWDEQPPTRMIGPLVAGLDAWPFTSEAPPVLTTLGRSPVKKTERIVN